MDGQKDNRWRDRDDKVTGALCNFANTPKRYIYIGMEKEGH